MQVSLERLGRKAHRAGFGADRYGVLFLARHVVEVDTELRARSVRVGRVLRVLVLLAACVVVAAACSSSVRTEVSLVDQSVKADVDRTGRDDTDRDSGALIRVAPAVPANGNSSPAARQSQQGSGAYQAPSREQLKDANFLADDRDQRAQPDVRAASATPVSAEGQTQRDVQLVGPQVEPAPAVAAVSAPIRDLIAAEIAATRDGDSCEPESGDPACGTVDTVGGVAPPGDGNEPSNDTATDTSDSSTTGSEPETPGGDDDGSVLGTEDPGDGYVSVAGEPGDATETLADCERRPWARGCAGPVPEDDDFQAGDAAGAESGPGAGADAGDDSSEDESGVSVPQDVIDILLTPGTPTTDDAPLIGDAVDGTEADDAPQQDQP